MYNILLIGAGQLGSRHLQALKSVKHKLNIFVVDSSKDSLQTAKERYNSIQDNKTLHSVNYSTFFCNTISKFDLAIVATNSNARREVIENALEKYSIKYFILEKLLFQKKVDYIDIINLFSDKNITAWVNCPMRQISFYKEIKKQTMDSPFFYTVTGSNYGLITNAIHYIDHMAFLTGSTQFTINTQYLNTIPVKSKRKGFLELNGMLQVEFKDGSIGSFNCYDKGNLPVIVEISSPKFRFISRESEGLSWVSNEENNWEWSEIPTKIPFQSQLTTELVESILESGTCQLVSFQESVKIHQILLEALLDFLNKNTKNNIDYYPFT